MAYISGVMPKGPNTVRKEVHLLPDVVKDLQDIAKSQKRSIKNLMEFILEEFAQSHKASKSKSNKKPQP